MFTIAACFAQPLSDRMVMSYVAARTQFPRPTSSIGARRSWHTVRVLDLVAATLLAIFIAPLMILLAVLIRLQDGGPAVFSQERIGEGGRTFRCFKFRSMVIDADRRLELLLAENPSIRLEWDRDHKLRDDPRVTPLGAFLRKSSLDEIPQLFNVLRGEMSLVGPRPIVSRERIKYGRRFSAYCSVPPGITGLWQVSGRNDVSYRRRVAMDVLYSRNKNFGFDVLLLIKTVPAVLTRKGSY
jgi:exopolysaccharide production protein ExoY